VIFGNARVGWIGVASPQGSSSIPDGIDRLKLRLADTKTAGKDGIQIRIYERA
jgi:hypothetical protein